MSRGQPLESLYLKIIKRCHQKKNYVLDYQKIPKREIKPFKLFDVFGWIYSVVIHIHPPKV